MPEYINPNFPPAFPYRRQALTIATVVDSLPAESPDGSLMIQSGTLYFRSGGAWNAVGRGGGSQNIAQVLDVGSDAARELIYGLASLSGIIGDDGFTIFGADSSGDDDDGNDLTLRGGDSNGSRGSAGGSLNIRGGTGNGQTGGAVNIQGGVDENNNFTPVSVNPSGGSTNYNGSTINLGVGGGVGGGAIKMDGGFLDFPNLDGDYGDGISSQIKTGDFDNERGANGGISLFCAVGFQSNWQAGIQWFNGPGDGAVAINSGMQFRLNGWSDRNWGMALNYAGVMLGGGVVTSNANMILCGQGAGEGIAYVAYDTNSGTSFYECANTGNAWFAGTVTATAFVGVGSGLTGLTLSQITNAGTAASLDVGLSPGNVPQIGGGGTLDTSILPPLTIANFLGDVADQTAMLALPADASMDGCWREDTSSFWFYLSGDPTNVANWRDSGLAAGVVTWNGLSGTVSVTTDDLPEGASNFYWTSARFNTALGTKTTSDLAEGSNLYFTNGRAQSACPAVTLGTANGLSLSTQALSLALATTGTPGAMSAADKTFLDVLNTRSSATITSQSAAGNIITLTPAADGTFRLGGWVTITAISVDVLQLQCTWTDETSTSRTKIFFPQGITSADLASTGAFTFPTMDIRAKSGSAITIKTVLTTGIGSITFDAGALIEKIY